MAGRIKKFITSPAGALGMFALAAVLLLFSSVGGARAALTYYSETYTSRVQMYDIGVTLLENGEEISWRNSRKGLLEGANGNRPLALEDIRKDAEKVRRYDSAWDMFYDEFDELGLI